MSVFHLAIGKPKFPFFEMISVYIFLHLITFSSANQGQSDIIYGALSDRFNLRADILNTGEFAYQSRMKLNYSTDFRITSIEINGVSQFLDFVN